MNHTLKTWPRFFRAVRAREKPFEIRKADRPYAVGDTLTLEEFEPCEKCGGTGERRMGDGLVYNCADCSDSPKGRYTGQWIIREVTFILSDPEFGLQPGFIAMGLRECELTLTPS